MNLSCLLIPQACLSNMQGLKTRGHSTSKTFEEKEEYGTGMYDDDDDGGIEKWRRGTVITKPDEKAGKACKKKKSGV